MTTKLKTNSKRLIMSKTDLNISNFFFTGHMFQLKNIYIYLVRFEYCVLVSSITGFLSEGQELHGVCLEEGEVLLITLAINGD